MSISSRRHVPRNRSLARLQHHLQRSDVLRDLKPKRLRPAQDGQAPQPPRETEAPSILIVDDSEATRQAVAELLREDGYTVHAASGMHEMEHVSRTIARPPELALLEFRLRDGRGDFVAARLRERWANLFILYFSCLHPDDDPALRSALLAPATALLFKPTSLDAILQAVQAFQSSAGSQAPLPSGGLGSTIS